MVSVMKETQEIKRVLKTIMEYKKDNRISLIPKFQEFTLEDIKYICKKENVKATNVGHGGYWYFYW